LEFIIVEHVHTPISKWVQLNVVINKLLKSIFHYFHILTFRNSFEKMLFSWPLILSIVFLLLFSIKKSQYEIVYRHTPDYHFLRVFGCACWLYLQPYNKHKIDFKSKNCIFIGYSLNHHGYKCLDLATCKVYVSRHVAFYENNFPYKSLAQTPSICQDSNSIVIPFSNTISPLSLTSTGSHAPSHTMTHACQYLHPLQIQHINHQHVLSLTYLPYQS